MSFWISSLIATGAAVAACSFSDLKRAILALWIAGLGVGGVYLSLGAELLAVVQWSISTLVTISFIFYATLFGELGVSDGRTIREQILSSILPVLVSGSLVVVVSLAARRLLGWNVDDLIAMSRPVEVQNLTLIGKRLVTDHLPALQILGFLLFMVVIGAGVLSRPEMKEDDFTQEDRG